MRITPEIDPSRAAKDGLCPLMLRLVYKAKRERWNTGIRIPAKGWNSKAREIRSTVYGAAKLNAQLAAHLQRAKDIVLDRPGITPKELAAALNAPSRDPSILLHDAMKAAYEAHEHRWRYGTKKGKRTILQDVLTALPTVTLAAFDRPHLLQMERWYASRATNTRRTRLRRLSALYVMACEHHGISPKVVPAKSAPSAVKTIKVRLTEAQVEALRSASWELPTANMRLAVHTWLLQYDLGGLRFNEACRLHTDMLHGDAYRWVEGKVFKPRYHRVNAKAQAVIDYYAGRGHVLPLVADGLTGDAFDKAVESANTIVNRELRKVCAMLGLPRVTTHNARHTAAHRIRKVTKDIHAAQRILGHASAKQTEDYLNDLDTSPMDEVFDKLA